jgi:hypothetical protein
MAKNKVKITINDASASFIIYHSSYSLPVLRGQIC